MTEIIISRNSDSPNRFRWTWTVVIYSFTNISESLYNVRNELSYVCLGPENSANLQDWAIKNLLNKYMAEKIKLALSLHVSPREGTFYKVYRYNDERQVPFPRVYLEEEFHRDRSYSIERECFCWIAKMAWKTLENVPAQTWYIKPAVE